MKIEGQNEKTIAVCFLHGLFLATELRKQSLFRKKQANQVKETL